jgi:transposase
VSGEAWGAQAHPLFSWWHRVRDGTLAPARYTSYRRPIRREVEWRLEAGQTCGVSKTEGTCRERFKRCQALWTVVRHIEVEPTNTAADRAIRPGGTLAQRQFGNPER